MTRLKGRVRTLKMHVVNDCSHSFPSFLTAVFLISCHTTNDRNYGAQINWFNSFLLQIEHRFRRRIILYSKKVFLLLTK